MMLQTKRVYEVPQPSDGPRILIDRLWPRGMTKARAQIDYWARSIAPSSALRKWYQHDSEKWSEFERRYLAELEDNSKGIEDLEPYLRGPVVTIVFASKEETLNNAAVLATYLRRTSDLNIAPALEP